MLECLVDAAFHAASKQQSDEKYSAKGVLASTLIW